MTKLLFALTKSIIAIAFGIAFASTAGAQEQQTEVLIQSSASGDLDRLKSEFPDLTIRQLEGQAQVWMLPRDQFDRFNERALEARNRIGVADFNFEYMTGHYTNVFAMAPDAADLTPKQQQIVGNIAERNPNYSVLALAPQPVVRYALDTGWGAADGLDTDNSITMSLTEGIAITAVREKSDDTEKGRVWRGKVVSGTIRGQLEELSGDALLISTEDSMSGTVQVEGTVYTIRPLGGGLHAVYEKNIEALPEDHPPQKASPESNRDIVLVEPPTADVSPGPYEVTIVVAYTEAAGSNYNNIEQDLIAVAEAETNASFANTDIANLTVRVVHSYQTSYDERGKPWDNHLEQFSTDNDNVMDEIHGFRNTHKGDVAVLITDDGRYCGEAEDIGAGQDDAFAVVYHDCATGYYSFAHEIAHLFGSRHDRGVDSNNRPFRYGHAFLNIVGSPPDRRRSWRTIMGYGNLCGGCPRMQYWSSPLIQLDGVTAGSTTYEDNARVLDERAYAISRFRN